MAQIVTITNPLTGQPAQVDQLEHTAQQIDDAIARALPGGGIDTLLAGKAPGGYGLGTSYSPEIDDCNTATKNGWYHVKGATLNKPFNKVGALLVVCRGSTQMYQLFFVGETYDTGGSCIIVRSMYGGTWGPWEWVNPPMALGVEYRTTERFNRKTVYAKAVSVGDIEANKLVVANSFSNGGEAVVRCFAIAKYASGIVTSPQNLLFNCTLVANGLVYAASNNQVRVCIKADSNMTDGVAVAYYTKA